MGFLSVLVNKYNRHLVKEWFMGFLSVLVNKYNRHLVERWCKGFLSVLVIARIFGIFRMGTIVAYEQQKKVSKKCLNSV
jgi:hypothetical protein